MSNATKRPAPAPVRRKTPWALWVGVAVLAAVVVYLATKPAGPKPGNVDNAAFAAVIADAASGVRVVDVRTAAEYASGHIPGAENVPVDQVPAAIAGWSKTAPIAVYCATGARSLNAAEYLRAQGFTQVYNLTAGIAAWDGEVVQGDSAGTAGGAAKVQTNGKPVLIEFSGST